MLWQTSAVLLEMPVRILHLSELHGEKFLGNVLQWHYLAMSGLRRTKRVWQPVIENPRPLPSHAADTAPAVRADGADAAFVAAKPSVFPLRVLWFRDVIF
jgi:hypothetical protein